MIDPESRYAHLGKRTLAPSGAQEAGREITYVPRRFLPLGRRLPLLAEQATVDGERMDHFTTRTLGDPEQFWRICDANDAMRPAQLVREPGRVLRVPVPQPEG